MTKQRIAYFVACIDDFASHFGLSPREAYAYLERHGGMRFLIDCYEAEHTLSIQDAINDMAAVCHRNGGQLL